ncbi:hypothetical protein NBRC116583_35550 [Arenicella sp. 4NH20-0111]|uniref:hypothetical protein n=1 Tax=Arenicella sp. 4NH20-0111 TaxID=3127648 RepID=UPI003103674F
MYNASAYALYIVISIIITVVVSKTLSRNGEVYLIDGFNGNEVLAKSVNHMLVVGFYLLNVGFVLLRMETALTINEVDALLLYLSSNIGIVLFVLGIMHFINMYLINRFRNLQINKVRDDVAFNRSLNANQINNAMITEGQHD